MAVLLGRRWPRPSAPSPPLLLPGRPAKTDCAQLACEALSEGARPLAPCEGKAGSRAPHMDYPPVGLDCIARHAASLRTSSMHPCAKTALTW